MQQIFSFFELKDQVGMQVLSKRFYDRIIPAMRAVTPLAGCQLIFENNRKEIYVGQWGIAKDLKKKQILKISDKKEEGAVTLEELGITKGEVSFQWFLPISSHSFIVYPLVEEAHLQHAVRLDFNQNTWKFEKATQLASIPKQLMRPTAVHAMLAQNLGGKSIILIGGTEARENWAYSIENNTYRKLATLPVGHNITTNVCVNYKNQAVFTFIHDAKLNIKVAVLDLLKIDQDEEEESKKSMEWVLKMEQTQHTLDRFHLKSGVTMADNRIAIMARGRLPGMREQIASLILYFTISKGPDGKWNAAFDATAIQIIWPTIFPRQLDPMQRCNDTLVMT